MADSASDRRRRQRTTDESWQSGGTALSNVDHTCEKFRVGAPSLYLLPLSNYRVEETEPEYRIFNDLQPSFEEVLAVEGIDYEEVAIYHRRIKGPAPSNPKEDLTILVHATWAEGTSEERWRSSVEAMRAILIQRNLQYITVEILSWELESPKYMSVVEAGHPFVEAYSTGIRDKVKAILNEEPDLEENWWAIDVIRLGYDSDRKDNPIVISITVDWSLDPPNWATAERLIQDTLNEGGFREIEVLFQRGEVQLFTFAFAENKVFVPPMLPKEYIVKPGASISGTSYLKDTAGAFLRGPFGSVGVIMRVFKGGELHGHYVLTNYHVIRPWIPGWQIGEEREDNRGRSELHPIENSVCHSKFV
jgi:hypothetical protein